MKGVFATIVDGAFRFVWDYDHELENEPFPRLVMAAQDFILGLYYGFPLCCVMAYCRDVLDDHSPGVRREFEVGRERLGHDRGYVPCIGCAITEED